MLIRRAQMDVFKKRSEEGLVDHALRFLREELTSDVEGIPDDVLSTRIEWTLSLDAFLGGNGFLVQIAFRGSPGLLLIDDPQENLLGYFEKSLVPRLYGVFYELSEDVEKVLFEKDDATEAVLHAFLSALEEANSRGFAVAILHGE